LVNGKVQPDTAAEAAMTTNPFEDDNASYQVLVNDDGQHSLWPAFAEVPAGWRVVYGQDSRQECLAYVDRNWTDQRPLSLVRQTESSGS
jgi:MbtH protein